jgi:uncharacterized protein YecA (UPF0149 family)
MGDIVLSNNEDSLGTSLYKFNEDDSLNIQIDFTALVCECGHSNAFNEKKCNKCGLPIDSEIDGHDPIVKLRKEKFKELLEFIEKMDLKIKYLRKDIRAGLTATIIQEDFINFIQSRIDKMTDITSNNLFNGISFKKEVLETLEMKNKINEIELYFKEIYLIYEELLKVTPYQLWDNAYKRLIKAIGNYLKGYKLIIQSLVSDTLQEALELNNLAQNSIDNSVHDINIFANILHLKNIEVNFELLSEGNINTSVLFLMMLSGKNDYSDISSSYVQIQKFIYLYFEDFLKLSLDDYLASQALFRIIPYSFLGMASFSEEKYFNKIRVVLQVLEGAYKIDSYTFKQFLDRFIIKYVYALKKMEEIAQEIALQFSYNRNKKLLIKSSLRWYKDFSEGIFRDISSVLIKSAYIVNKNEIEDDYLIEWMGFPDKLNYLENNTKLRLNILTDGVEKILRHSEAHVDYDINEITEEIVVRNKQYDKKTKTGTINELKYSFEEFLNLQNDLTETISSIIAGIEIFIANNFKDFKDFMIRLEESFDNILNQYGLEFSLPAMGVNIERVDEIIECNKKILLVKGISIERTDKEFLEKLIPCLSPVIVNNQDIDLIRLEMFDINNIDIGSVEVFTKYLRQFRNIGDKYKKYETLLISVTSKFDYKYEQDTIYENDDYGFKFTFAILQFIIPLANSLRDLRISIFNNRSRNIPILSDIQEEFMYMIKTISEYERYVFNTNLLVYVKEIIMEFNSITERLKRVNGKNFIHEVDLLYKLYSKDCFRIADITSTNGDAQKIGELLSSNDLIDKKELFLYVGRNEACPCGSGKKYKKCCIYKYE